MVVTHLSLLTLNCWGVFTPGACQHRKERIHFIGEELSKGIYDIVLLQEIWTQADYNTLSDRLADTYAYTHYWHSGTWGSGLCIFTKYPIIDTFTLRFTLNGYAHKLEQGDWHCGKAVGLAKLLVNDIRINVYSTHTHAWYDANPFKSDVYAAHRAAQGFEMSQFIKHTAEGCDAVIVGGDFNSMPEELPYRIIKHNANLLDAWLTQKRPLPEVCEDKMSPGGSKISGACASDVLGATNGRPDNIYTAAKEIENFPNGYRIDYIMYRANGGYGMSCEACQLAMGKIRGQEFPYSDHEGLSATFTIRPDPVSGVAARPTGEIEKDLTDALPLINTGIKKVKSDQVFFSVVAFLCLVALTFTSSVQMPYGMNMCMYLVRFFLAVAIGFCVWMVLVMCNSEINGLTAIKKDMNNLLRSNPGHRPK